MADETFFSLLTDIGAARIANALATGGTVTITEIAVGDGDGAYYTPTEAQTALRNEVWRGTVSTRKVDADNPNHAIFEGVILADTAAFTIREAGILDDAGNLIAVAKLPETYKPALAQGAGKDVIVRFTLQTTHTDHVTILIDPGTAIATVTDVADAIDAHDADPDAHAEAIDTHDTDPEAHIHTARTFEAPQRMKTTDLGDVTGIVATDFGAAEYFKLATTGDISIANPTNIVVGQQGRIVLDNTVGYALTGMGTYWKRAGDEGVPEMAARGRIDYDVVAADRIEYVWLDVEE